MRTFLFMNAARIHVHLRVDACFKRRKGRKFPIGFGSSFKNDVANLHLLLSRWLFLYDYVFSIIFSSYFCLAVYCYYCRCSCRCSCFVFERDLDLFCYIKLPSVEIRSRRTTRTYASSTCFKPNRILNNKWTDYICCGIFVCFPYVSTNINKHSAHICSTHTHQTYTHYTVDAYMLKI